jgi:methyl-accepting chemotaxis protein
MDVEKTIEFLLEHQARFAADLDVMKDEQRDLRSSLVALQDSVAGLQESVAGLRDSVHGLSDAVMNQQRQIGEIIGATKQLALVTQEALREQARELLAVNQAQRRTEENLNALIKVVDDVVRRDGGRRGGRRKPD